MVLGQLVRFVTESSASLKNTGQNTSMETLRELPVAAVMAGINAADHSWFYSQLSASLLAKGHLVATLNANDASCIKFALRNVIEDLCGCERTVDVDEEVTSGAATGSATVPSYSMDRLLAWYRYRCATETTPGKLVVVIQQFEAFDPIVVSRLVQILSGRLNELPFVLVVGLSTSAEAMHQSLSRSIVALMKMEKFRLHNCHESINKVTQLLQCDSQSVFRLGSRPYQQLLDNFHLHDLSVSAFTRGVQYCIMAFYYSNPLSVLTQARDWSQDALRGVLTQSLLLRIRMLPSVQKMINELASSSSLLNNKDSQASRDLAVSLLTDDDVLISSIAKWIQDMKRYQAQYSRCIHLVLFIQNCFESPTLHRPVRTLIADGLRGNLMDTEHMKTLFMMVKKLKFDKVKAILQKLNAIECDHPFESETQSDETQGDDDMDTVDEVESTTIIESQDTAAILLQKAALFEPSDDDESVDSEACYVDEDVADKRAELESEEYEMKMGLKRAKQMVKNTRRTKVSTILKPIEDGPIDAEQSEKCWILASTNYIKQYLQKAFVRYTDVLLNELFYFSDATKSIEKTFDAQPRSVLHTALSRSDAYLACLCCKSIDEECIEPCLEDTCIAYRLYLECGRMINMYDWFTAFATIVNPTTEDDDGKSDDSDAQSIQ